jgi:hypothetical protein
MFKVEEVISDHELMNFGFIRKVCYPGVVFEEEPLYA